MKERSGKACDHWNRFREDFSLAKSLCHNAHRFSFEWSRIEPEEGHFNDEVISHYQEVLESLKDNGLEPIVTLNHYTLPLISENGICSGQDEERVEFIQAHLTQLAKAIQEGTPVIGYIYWSLLDNFEWAEGFAPRFGLVRVDYTTQERHVRPSAKAYAEICRTNRIKFLENLNRRLGE